MDALQVKVIEGKVHVDYTSLYDLQESFYEEFNLKEYREKLNEFKENNNSEISNNCGKLKFLYKGKDTCLVFSRDGRETQIVEDDLSSKLFI